MRGGREGEGKVGDKKRVREMDGKTEGKGKDKGE